MLDGHPNCEMTIGWERNSRWQGIKRPYTPDEVLRLRGTVKIEYSLARMGAERLWQLMQKQPICPRPGGGHRQPGGANGAGRPASHLPQRLAGGRGCQRSRHTYPDQSLYPATVPPSWLNGSTMPCCGLIKFTI